MFDMLKAKPFLINILLTFSCLFATETKAQKLKFQLLGTEDGLPASEVYNLLQDANGYVWAFTEYGIVKHNGKRFVPVCKNLPFEESTVYAICESPGKEIYIANSKAHIYRVKNDSAFLVKGIEKISYKIILNNETIYQMQVDDSLNLYFSTFDNSYKLEKKSGNIIPISDFYNEDSVNVVFKKIGNSYFFIKTHDPVSKNNYFKLVDSKGLLKKVGNRYSFIKTHDPVIDNNYFKIIDSENKQQVKQKYYSEIIERDHLREMNGTYYFLSKYELISIDRQGRIKKTKFHESTINLESDPNGHIWVGTNKGLYELNENLEILNYYFENLNISDILFDRQGGMWVSSIEKGIYYCKDIYTTYYDNIPELSGNISLVKKVGTKLFVGTGNGSLFVNESDSLRKIDMNNNGSYITDATIYDGQYMIGTKNGGHILDENLTLVDKYFQPFERIVPDGYCNPYGFGGEINDTLVFITAAGIYKKYKSNLFLGPQNMFKTRSIVDRSPNEHYIGTPQGVYLFNQRVYIPDYLKVLEGKNITHLKVDSKKNIWIGTKGAGLYVLTQNNHLIRIKNVPSNVVNNISFVDDTTFLLSTNKGLFITTKSVIDAASSWRLLYDNEIVFAEEYKDKVYIATKQGLVAMSKKRLFSSTPSPLYLESVTVNDKKIDCRNLQLSYSQNDLYFDFNILEYGKKDPSFFYELQGPYGDKGKISGNVLRLQNLQPGNYRLYVYLRDDDNRIKKNVLYIPFYIKPAFWQTNLFIFEIIVTVIAICVFFTGFFYDRLKKKQERKTMITRLIIEQRLTALKAQINPHFISNSLTAIQQLILENNIDKANQYIAKFSFLIRYTLNYSDKSAACLRNELDIVDLNIELERLRFSNKFIFEKQIGNDIGLDEIFIPPLITQPLIENAIWHGLMPLKNERTPKLILKIRITAGKLIISVIDNGVGRPKIMPGAEPNKRESKGTWLVMNRIANLNRLHPQNKSEFRFIDLLAADGSPAGSRVDLLFPLNVLDELYDNKNESLNN
ncbi:MAG: hypothetical protein JWP12_2569 [Bacteroidetes bacterium]|nr:hypothetical protein [Bacteroidota bacterium]